MLCAVNILGNEADGEWDKSTIINMQGKQQNKYRENKRVSYDSIKVIVAINYQQNSI